MYRSTRVEKLFADMIVVAVVSTKLWFANGRTQVCCCRKVQKESDLEAKEMTGEVVRFWIVRRDDAEKNMPQVPADVVKSKVSSDSCAKDQANKPLQQIQSMPPRRKLAVERTDRWREVSDENWLNGVDSFVSIVRFLYFLSLILWNKNYVDTWRRN